MLTFKARRGIHSLFLDSWVRVWGPPKKDTQLKSLETAPLESQHPGGET